MSNDEFQFRTLADKGPRVNKQETAWLLNCQLHDIAVLEREGLITPLGHPRRNSKRFFGTKAIQKAAEDYKWLCKMTDAISAAWRDRNSGEEDAEGQEDVKVAA